MNNTKEKTSAVGNSCTCSVSRYGKNKTMAILLYCTYRHLYHDVAYKIEEKNIRATNETRTIHSVHYTLYMHTYLLTVWWTPRGAPYEILQRHLGNWQSLNWIFWLKCQLGLKNTKIQKYKTSKTFSLTMEMEVGIVIILWKSSLYIKHVICCAIIKSL